jgi:mono/diheme cytochrome c family protein
VFPTAAAILAAALAAVALAGCGETGGASAAAALGPGRQIFARSCSGCHTLTGRESATSGGNLLNAHLSVADLASFAGEMPTPQPLSRAEILAVAEYVHSVATSAAGRHR